MITARQGMKSRLPTTLCNLRGYDMMEFGLHSRRRDAAT